MGRLTERGTYNGDIGIWVKEIGGNKTFFATYDEGLKAIEKLAHYEDREEKGRLIVTPETGIGDLSDGYHTFNELYHHRAVLFSVICNAFKSCAWKSKKHSDGTMYDGMFIVGIDTPEGSATYHYDIEPYWNMFDVKELDKAPEWDGHTPDDAINRIAKLKENESNRCVYCQDGKSLHGQKIIPTNYGWQAIKYCPNCGAKMVSEAKLKELEGDHFTDVDKMGKE